jgi:hypothetical protein
MMKHPAEEELIAYHDGEADKRQWIATHLADCPQCRAELEHIDEVLSALNTMTVPDPGEDYGQRVWQKIEPRLPQRREHWWPSFPGSRAQVTWLEPRRWAAAGAIVALVVAAFLAGRVTKKGVPVAVEPGKVRERVLIMAVGEHLGHSEMMLVELANAEPQGLAQKRVDISGEQRRAEDLLEENRLFRQTALQQGDTSLASMLDELERVLVDVSHSPDNMTPAELQAIRQRIEARGILFKVRVVGKELRQREESGNVSPAQNDSRNRERNKI